ncbi:non-canonical purine NTP pyrophosphatase [Paenibacillus turpanensis]|uniref:non-canonical purine NTP pyrophosphatase n=1 Tax=Paenibacillus turpanensis TaxID=2689078 RepID=UPI00140E2384
MSEPNKVIVVATRNAGKVKEFAHAFAELGVAVRSLADYPEAPEVVEDGATFADNALKKAKTIAEALGVAALADDSGLCVDELDGAPGVYSARYAGEPSSDEQNNAKLVRELRRVRGLELEAGGLPDFGAEDEGTEPFGTARFVASLAYYDPASGEVLRAEGTCEGEIIPEPRGEGGFGYDPHFYVPQLGKTMAELTVAEKQQISHRGKALERLLGLWEQKARESR